MYVDFSIQKKLIVYEHIEMKIVGKTYNWLENEYSSFNNSHKCKRIFSLVLGVFMRENNVVMH